MTAATLATRPPGTRPVCAAVRRAAVYLRISDDREGMELGVGRQEEDTLALAATLGVSVSNCHIYRENDTGASTRSQKPRPRYAAMLAAARAGDIDVIIAYTSGRLTRRPRELEGQIELAEQHGIEYAYVASPVFDLNTAAGRTVARILAATDTGEAEQIAERVARARTQRAQSGRWGGGIRPYGFRVPSHATGCTCSPGKRTCGPSLVIDESEAPVIKTVAANVLDGISLRSETKRLNDAGIPAAKGGRWHSPDLRNMLLRPLNAGLLTHRGEVVEGATLDAGAIITPGQWRALVALLRDPSRKTTQGPAAAWLGSGIFRCVCGTALRCRTFGGAKTPSYHCPNSRDRSTKHAARTVKAVDGYVTAVVLDYLSAPGAVDLLSAPQDSGVDVGALRARERELLAEQDDLVRIYRAKTITVRQLETATADLNAEIATLRARVDRHIRTTAFGPLVGDRPAWDVWDAMPLGVRRAVMSELVDVTILPVGNGSRFDNANVRIEWRR